VQHQLIINRPAALTVIDIRFYKGPGSSDRPVTTHLPVRTFKFASDWECVRTVRTHTRVTRYDSGAGQEADSESAGSVTVMTELTARPDRAYHAAAAEPGCWLSGPQSRLPSLAASITARAAP
jgi:hypothetical protein